MDAYKKIEDMLYQIFRDEKIKYFQSSDAYRALAGDTYIRYGYLNSSKGAIIIFVGGSQIEETPIRVCYTAEEIQKVVCAIIY